ncbi:hypothetical protein F5Y18DRAFT_433045 [Xylariaceae sp. FL1019]|nr:hypothetical protein F5Y18DRAFT_433045 [Xylariaceae sp. FL1019]
MLKQDPENAKMLGDAKNKEDESNGPSVKATLGKQEDSRAACLSVDEHDTEIRDPLAHFMGCLEFWEREEFFDEDKPIWEEELTYQLSLMRAGQEPPSEAQHRKAQEAVEKLKSTWQKTIGTELRRITFLREHLSQDEHDNQLVNAVNIMRERWRGSDEYAASIDRVRNWRKAQGKSISVRPNYREPTSDSPASALGLLHRSPLTISLFGFEAYDVEKDMTVPVIQFERKPSTDVFVDPTYYFGKPRLENPSEGLFNSTTGIQPDTVSKFRINSYDDERLGGKFPNQKTTVHKLFDEADGCGVLSRSSTLSKDTDLIRYVHIPSNNMIWAEKAIAKYYGDWVPNFNAMHRQLQRPLKTATSMILQERYWRGQLHGDSQSPPHARYMSPMCETISSSPNTPDYDPKNIVLFMPYLHWEISRRREQFSSEIDMIVLSSARDKAKQEGEKKSTRMEQRDGLHKPTKQSTSPTPTRTQNHKRNVSQIHQARFQQTTSKIETLDDAVEAKRKLMRPFAPTHHLGRYLIAAARLSEGMSTYRDKMLLREYLPRDPPIHPRRTLDQAFYWTLNSTKKRDKDQVVYRGTTTRPTDFHRYDTETSRFPDHDGLEGDCNACSINIKKVSRVVMVDQLWMWVLDEKTIITCFPKRCKILLLGYFQDMGTICLSTRPPTHSSSETNSEFTLSDGANKQDYSGVHKSIRTRLESFSPNSIRTVFELALIILDECTMTFFDKAKALNRQPQVIDEFSKAIGNIMHKQSVAFSRLWRWTSDARKVYRSQGYTDTAGLHIPLLDINPEGHLEREIEDIIEELDIMLHISNTHKDIIKTFIDQAEHILDPEAKFGPADQGSKSQRHRKKSMVSGGDPSENEKFLDYQSFGLKAVELQDRVESHVKDLETLRKSAKNTAEDVNCPFLNVLHLLTMKQQQASVVQAWQAVKQSEETINQGRSIMVFTLATIVFLPLSFITSVFGMNNQEFGDNSWPIKWQLLYIFAISAAVVFISLLFAYSHWIRTISWSIYERVVTTVAVKTRAYELYLSHGKTSENIEKETLTASSKAKMEVKERFFNRRAQKRAQKEAEDNAKETELKRLIREETGTRLPDLELESDRHWVRRKWRDTKQKFNRRLSNTSGICAETRTDTHGSRNDGRGHFIGEMESSNNGAGTASELNNTSSATSAWQSIV